MENSVPKGLKVWFIIHFLVDILFAIPLMIMPIQFLSILGWSTIDPIAARIVAAALFGIGIESFLGRNGGAASFLAMLNLKIIWSSAVVIGIIITILFPDGSFPVFGWGLLGIFAAFNVVWVYWRVRLKKGEEAS
jgi:hypothetical protein